MPTAKPASVASDIKAMDLICPKSLKVPVILFHVAPVSVLCKTREASMAKASAGLAGLMVMPSIVPELGVNTCDKAPAAVVLTNIPSAPSAAFEQSFIQPPIYRMFSFPVAP